MEHTKGPWRVTALGHITSKECRVATVGDYTDKELLKFNKKRWDADARLIAAAPDLLAALQKALNESGCDGDLCCHEWHEASRSAISKATGK